MALNIGLNVPAPEKECKDVNCPFHGTLPVRGQVITGKVVSDRMMGTAVVARNYLHYVRKYKRYEKRKLETSRPQPFLYPGKGWRCREDSRMQAAFEEHHVCNR